MICGQDHRKQIVHESEFINICLIKANFNFNFINKANTSCFRSQPFIYPISEPISLIKLIIKNFTIYCISSKIFGGDHITVLSIDLFGNTLMVSSIDWIIYNSTLSAELIIEIRPLNQSIGILNLYVQISVLSIRAK